MCVRALVVTPIVCYTVYYYRAVYYYRIPCFPQITHPSQSPSNKQPIPTRSIDIEAQA
jgi:hypothetical protein